MRTLLQVLQTLHRYQTKELIQRLGVTEEQYKQIESGELQMSLQQVTALAELIKASTINPRSTPSVAIYNYNFGPKSRSVNYPTSYNENDYTNNSQNHETTNPQANG